MKKIVILSFCLLVGAGLNAGKYVYPKGVPPMTREDRRLRTLGEWVAVRDPDIIPEFFLGRVMIPALPCDEAGEGEYPESKPDLEAAERMCSFDARNQFEQGETVLVKWFDGTFRWAKVLYEYDDAAEPFWGVRVKPEQTGVDLSQGIRITLSRRIGKLHPGKGRVYFSEYGYTGHFTD